MEYNTNKNNIHLKDLLEYLGEKILKHGTNTYKLEKHDSLILKDYKFYWNSKQIGGNYYTLLKELYGLNKTQINNITQQFLDDIYEEKYIPGNKNNDNRLKVEMKNTKYVNNLNKIIDYLSNKRKIDEEIIKVLYNKKYINIDEKNNITFKILDKNNKYIGDELVGTIQNKKFKRNLTHFGFNITKTIDKEKIDNLYIFESSIDLISYLELSKAKQKLFDGNIRFLSISGLREDILENYIDDIKNLYVCTDNDLPGESLYKKLNEKYKNLNLYREKSVKKDWNEDLIENKKQKKLEDANLNVNSNWNTKNKESKNDFER